MNDHSISEMAATGGPPMAFWAFEPVDDVESLDVPVLEPPLCSFVKCRMTPPS